MTTSCPALLSRNLSPADRSPSLSATTILRVFAAPDRLHIGPLPLRPFLLPVLSRCAAPRGGWPLPFASPVRRISVVVPGYTLCHPTPPAESAAKVLGCYARSINTG